MITRLLEKLSKLLCAWLPIQIWHQLLLLGLPLGSTIFSISCIFSELSVMFHFYIELQQNNAMHFTHSSLSLTVLEKYKSTCPEGQRYLFQGNTVLISETHSLGSKICCRTGRNVKMSWQYICHHLQWDTERRLPLNELQTLLWFFFYFFNEQKRFFLSF